MKTTSEEVREIAAAIALPSRLAKATCKEMFGWDFAMPPHVARIEQECVQAVLNDQGQNLLMINLPPRHGKSFYMVYLCAWILGMFPHKRIMYVTYSDDFSVKWGRQVKELLNAYGRRFFGRGISTSASSSSDWVLEGTQGGMLSVGINGNITGRDADIVIIDDVIKDAGVASSKAQKAALIAQYDSAIRFRLEPTGTLIIISTRWAEDDLVGTLQQREREDPLADRWTKLIYPALAEPSEEEERELSDEDDFANWTDELGRHMGEALWPDRFPVEMLHRFRANNPITFATMYQQTPMVKEGGMFPVANWQYYKPELLPPLIRKVTKWDLAATEEGGDWTVGVTCGLGQDRKIYVLEVQRFRRDANFVEMTVANTAYRQGTAVSIGIEQERAGAGKTVISFYKRKLRGFQVTGEKPEGSKEDRAAPVSGHVAGGQILIPEDAEWLTDWLHEFKVFPRGKHDDQVDCLVYAFNDLFQGEGGVSVWTPDGLNLAAEDQMRRLFQVA